MFWFKTVNLLVLTFVFRHVRLDALICFMGDVCFMRDPTDFHTAIRLFAAAHAMTAVLAGSDIAQLQILLVILMMLFPHRLSLRHCAIMYAAIILLNLAALRTWPCLLFVLSDAALAVRDFWCRFPLDNVIVLSLYFLAHYAMVMSDGGVPISL